MILGGNMAFGRVTCFLIFLLFATWISFARARNQVGFPDSDHKIVSTEKGLLGAEHAATSKKWLGGRKAVLNRQMKELKADKVDEYDFVVYFNVDYTPISAHPPQNPPTSE
ncbi:hypothetical protein DITRI_Ditri17bG0110000 [Diplodiscus trichospermus]